MNTEVEEWKQLVINNDKWDYLVSNTGKIKVIKTGKLRSLCKRNYVSLTLFKNIKPSAFLVHTLVALMFVHNDDPINKPYVNHINHDPYDNRASNLEWCNHSDNVKHAHTKEGRKSTRKAVLRYDVDENNKPILDSVKEYAYVNLAKEEFGSHVSECLNGKSKTAYGYYWTYKDVQTNKVPMSSLDLTNFKQVENHNNFLVSKDGRVYNKSRQAFLTPRMTGHYQSVVLDNDHFCVHVLVMMHFGTGEPSDVVNHKDGNKLNNHVDNLEYATESQNTLHAYETGLRKLKAVLQFDLNGNFIREYKSATEAATVLNMKIVTHIGRACKDETKKTANSKWKYKTEELAKKYNLQFP